MDAHLDLKISENPCTSDTICSSDKSNVFELILEAIAEIRKDHKRPDTESITRYVVRRSGLDKGVIEGAIHSLQISGEIYIKSIRNKESYFINKDHSINPSSNDYRDQTLTAFSHNDSFIGFLDQIATPPKATSFLSHTLDPSAHGSGNNTTSTFLNIINKLVETNADISRQLSLERMNNLTLMEEISRLRAKDSEESNYKHSQVSINAKTVENDTSNTKKDNNQNVIKIVKQQAKDSGIAMIDKSIQVNISSNTVENDAFYTKTENPMPLDNENSMQLESQ